MIASIPSWSARQCVDRQALALALLALAACGRAEPPRPPVGVEQRRAEVAVPGLAWAGEAAMVGTADGARAYVAGASGVDEIEWASGAVRRIDGAALVSGGAAPLWIRRGPPVTAQWPGSAEVALPDGVETWQLALAPEAAVPLVSRVAHREIVLDGWRADGTRAWHVELPGRGYEVRLVAHLGEVVLVQAAGSHDEVDGWTGLTIALDAATGAERWRQAPRGQRSPVAHHAIARGDEVALVYEAQVDVVAIADGALRRRVTMDKAWMSIADQVGFDGDVVWSFQHEPPHDNPGSHMIGTFPREPSPARCTYLVYDTRHDRGRAVRTEADATGPAREWLVDCTAHALLPLAGGGAQLLVVPEDGVLQAIWFDRAP